MEADIDIPEVFGYLFDPPLGETRYRVAYGGRGSAKSWQFARALLIHGYKRQLRVLCAREYQSSMRESVHHLLAGQIESIGLTGFYDVQQGIIRGVNGTEFIFKGIRRNVTEIKSTEGVDVCWIEEAESVTDQSWRVIIPTIRKPGSEIWVSFNPALETDPTYQRFVLNAPERAIVRKVGYRDNRFLPDVLKQEAEELRRRDPDAYEHVWGGETWRRSDAQVFAGKYSVDTFTPGEDWDGPYFGADWGFSVDPTVLVKAWIHDETLYIEKEVSGVGWDMNEIARRFSEVPGSDKNLIYGDGARPETIHEISRRGFTVKPAPKWAGSVEDGVSHMRSYKSIVVHPSCTRSVQEFRLYSYEVDKAGNVRPKIKDLHNHAIDAIRYALSPVIQQRAKPGFY